MSSSLVAAIVLSNPFHHFMVWAREHAPKSLYSDLGVAWSALAALTCIAVLDMIIHVFRPDRGKP